MGITRADPREFVSTYFMLRLALVGAAAIVLIAPVAARFHDGVFPSSISDSWYTVAQAPFVIGLAAASTLLIVIRGDTLAEQCLLNIAGGLGLLVAAVACHPGDGTDRIVEYDPKVVAGNRAAILTLLVVALLAFAIGALLPREMIGTGWNTLPVPRRVFVCLGPIVYAVIALGMARNAEWMATHLHGIAAFTMFGLLAVVAFLRTRWGLGLLARLGDKAVDESLGSRRLPEGSPATNRYDSAYAVIAASLIALPICALLAYRSSRVIVLILEAILLLVFLVFWLVQTREAWKAR